MKKQIEISLLRQWSFSKSQIRSLPIDSNSDNNIRFHIPKAIFSISNPTPVTSNSHLACFSRKALSEFLDMSSTITNDPDLIPFVTGKLIKENSLPLAHRYGGHQFGVWAGQLGDGRAHYLGDYINSQGLLSQLQLKGSGPTPYSRFGDGRAVLRSSVREFLGSEAMAGLKIPTSRASSLVLCDQTVTRDMFYDGRSKNERIGIVLRLAPSWFRFGSFEILSQSQEYKELKILLNYIYKNHFDAKEKNSTNLVEDDEKFLDFFSFVVEKTAILVAHWMSVGFAHGVLNTDNMSIHGITIDYGPFGFMEEYDPNFTPNSSDEQGRYDYKNQPSVVYWNLKQFASALKPLISESKHGRLIEKLEDYNLNYKIQRLTLFRNKLGLNTCSPKDGQIIQCLLDGMEESKADFSQTFRDLSEISLMDLNENTISISYWGLFKLRSSSRHFSAFRSMYIERLKEENIDESVRLSQMQSVNPRYILRNWMAQRIIEKTENNDFSELRLAHRILENPFQINIEAEKLGYANPPPIWSKKIKVSCSS